MRGGDHDPTIEVQLADGEIDHLRADQPELDDLCASLGRASHDRLRHRGRGEPHIPSYGDDFGLEFVDVGAADRVGAGLVQLVGIDPADVVGLEDLGIEHREDATGAGGK